jgi:hypothetical protein
VGCQ